MLLLGCSIPAPQRGRAGKSKLQWVSEAGAVRAPLRAGCAQNGGSEWAFRDEERLNPDGLLYIQLSSKSEEIAKYIGTKVHVLSCLTCVCDIDYKHQGFAASGAALQPGAIVAYTQRYYLSGNLNALAAIVRCWQHGLSMSLRQCVFKVVGMFSVGDDDVQRAS